MSIIILPGMGADSRMYEGPGYKNLNGVLFQNWPPYKGEQTIPEVAKRIIEENKVQENHTVGGSSLGGIVAAEIARQIKVQRLILIGSTLIPGNINPALRKLHNLAEIVPIKLVQLFAGKANLSLRNSLIEMFSQSESSFIRAMCIAIFEWEGNLKPNCEVRHIHGAKDKVILPPKNGADIIHDGGHLIAMTHGHIVAEYIKKSINPE
jgi:pimeloyl-ACP methyl ester carboxylesterase